MADLEKIVQTFEANTAQFDAAVEEVQNQLRQTGRVSDEASRRLVTGLQGASTGVVASSARMVGSARQLQGGFRSLGTQVGETIGQIARGRAPLEALAINATQAASAFGPMGLAVGVAGTALVAITSGLLSTAREAEGAADSVDDLIGLLKELGEQDTAVQRVIDALGDLSSEAQRAAALHVRIEFGDLQARAAEAADELVRGLEGALGSHRTQLALPGLDESTRAELELQVAAMTELVESFRAGRTEAIDFVEALERIPEGRPFSGLTADALEAFEAFRKARTELEAAQATLDVVSRRASSGPPPLGPVGRDRLAEGGRDRPARATAPPPSFADITAPLERENELLAEIGASREDIAAILRAEGQLKRELTQEEQDQLAAVLAVNKALEDRLKAGADRFVESDREAAQARVALEREGAAVTLAARTAAEVYADEIEHLRLLLAETAIDQETFNRAVAQAQVEMGEAGQSAQQLALHYELASETSQIFASTLASGVSNALFATGSLTDKLGRMGEALAEAVAQAIIFRSVMAAIGGPASGGAAATGLFGLFSGGGGGGGAPATGGGPIQLSPFFPAAERQHGGPVMPGVDYLVGERGPERFRPTVPGNIIPNGGGQVMQPVVNVYNETPAKVETGIDINGAIGIRIRSEVTGMARDGSLNRLTGSKPRGIARG